MIREVNLEPGGKLVATTDTGEKFVVSYDVSNNYGVVADGTDCAHAKYRFQKNDCKYYIWHSDTNTIEQEQ